MGSAGTIARAAEADGMTPIIAGGEQVRYQGGTSSEGVAYGSRTDELIMTGPLNLGRIRSCFIRWLVYLFRAPNRQHSATPFVIERCAGGSIGKTPSACAIVSCG